MVDSSNNKTSYLVNSQLPEFVRRDHPNFIQFLQAYYQFLEQEDGLMYTTKRFADFYDIDTLYDDWLIDKYDEGNVSPNTTFQTGTVTGEPYHNLNTEFFKNFAALIPTNIITNPVTVLKHNKDFYRSRGSQKSIRFLTRTILNKESSVYYPQDNILQASGGNWFIEKSLNIKNITVDNVANSIEIGRAHV